MQETESQDTGTSSHTSQASGASFLMGDVLTKFWDADRNNATILAAAKKKAPAKKKTTKKKPKPRPRPTKGPGCATKSDPTCSTCSGPRC